MANNTDDARFWDKIARKYASRPVADMAGYERTLERTRHYLKSTDTVFECGCGTGTTALKLAPHVAHYVAIDISHEMIAIGREKAAAQGCTNVTFETGTADDPDWSDDAFDAAFAFNVLHLIRNRTAALANLQRILKPGGHFIVKTPCLGDLGLFKRIGVRLFVFFMGLKTGNPPPLAYLTARDLAHEIESAGFSIVERGYHASRKRDIRPFLVAQKS